MWGQNQQHGRVQKVRMIRLAQEQVESQCGRSWGPGQTILCWPWLSITCWVTLLRKPDIKQVTRVCLQVLPRSLWASWPIIQDALDSLAQPLGGILIGLMPHSAHRTAIHVSASGPALWGSQVRSHNKPTLHTIFHPYLLKGRQKTGKMLTSQHEALKSSSFSKEPSIY